MCDRRMWRPSKCHLLTYAGNLTTAGPLSFIPTITTAFLHLPSPRASLANTRSILHNTRANRTQEAAFTIPDKPFPGKYNCGKHHSRLQKGEYILGVVRPDPATPVVLSLKLKLNPNDGDRVVGMSDTKVVGQVHLGGFSVHPVISNV